MRQFRPFEEDALRLLAGPVLGPTSLEAILAEADLVSYEYSGAGYFVTVRHSVLPANRIVISEPLVVGRAGDIQGGYLVFIEDGELMLECYSASSTEVPEGFRDLEVYVSAA